MIDVQIGTMGRLARAVLALVLVAQHDVLTRKAYGEPRRSVIAVQKHDARNTQVAANDRQYVIAGARVDHAPKVEVIRFAGFVHRRRDPAVEQDHRALYGRKLHGREVAIQDQDGQGENVGHVEA